MVMLGHLSFYPNSLPVMMDGSVAVEAFYIVSGFLITLVLVEKYDGRLLLFYSNRFLRLFPIYWAVLAAYVVANVIVANGWFTSVVFHPSEAGNVSVQSALWWSRNHPTGFIETAILAFLNLFIVGQDLTRSLGEPQSNLYYHLFIYVRVAWTVGVEIAFYAMAPFVVRSVSKTSLILVLSFLGQLVIAKASKNPYDTQLFVYEAWLFMAGSLAYRAYAWLRHQPDPRIPLYCIAATVVLFVMTVCYYLLGAPRLTYLFVAAICLPGVVLLGRRNRFDNIMGEFSYPLYLIHPLAQIITFPGKFMQPLALMAVFLLTWLVVKYIEHPIERYRQKRVRLSSALPAAAPGIGAESRSVA
jgi:peptidoglycan/LPS O-acetylase OafA/YrhL